MLSVKANNIPQKPLFLSAAFDVCIINSSNVDDKSSNSLRTLNREMATMIYRQFQTR